MRFLDIAFITILLNLSAGMIAGLGLFPGGTGVEQMDNFANFTSHVIAAQKNLDTPVSGSEIADPFAGVKLFVDGTVAFIGMMATLPIAFPAMLHSFGVPPAITIPIGVMMVLVYVIAIIQIIRGGGFKDYE